MSTRSDYFAFIQAAAERDLPNLQGEVDRWLAQFNPEHALFGYSPIKLPLQAAVVLGFLAEQTGSSTQARQALDLLLRYQEWKQMVPVENRARRPEYAEGIPPLDCAFDPILLAGIARRIRPQITPEEYSQLGILAADSLRQVWRFPEWGGHNRAMLRAASLASCAQAFPAEPEAPGWLALADELAEESWGRWSIEDAMMYQSHWLRAMVLYAEARGKEAELAGFLQPRHHIKAMTQLISPIGILPDFGDSHWLMHSPWEWLALLEWGARAYRDSVMKWAADRIWQAQQAEAPNLYGANVLTLAWRWCDDTILPQPPGETPDALDDLVIKKLVFRTGWEGGAAYACVNYRDEGDYGKVARDYLRTNLAVSAEKMHHGHSDEGSFSLLTWNGSILLHESGYREAPPDGIYRADIYHNRVIWRNRVRLPGEGAWDFLHDNGHYKPLRTERLYQTHLLDADIRRIRMRDEAQRLDWDRTIFFLPEIPAWVVMDTALAHQTAPRTLSCLWWGTEIVNRGTDWLDTTVSHIHSWQNQPGSALRIYLPGVPGQRLALAVDEARRDFQPEQMISHTWSGEQRAGRAVNFVSVLVPHLNPLPDGAELPQVEVVPSTPAGQGIAVRVRQGGVERILATLNDLTTPYLQEDIRPRYTAAQGWTQYGSLASDAALVYARMEGTSGRAGFINGTRLEYAGRCLHQALVCSMFQEDATSIPGVPARFRWEGAI